MNAESLIVLIADVLSEANGLYPIVGDTEERRALFSEHLKHVGEIETAIRSVCAERDSLREAVRVSWQRTDGYCHFCLCWPISHGLDCIVRTLEASK